MHGLRLHRGWSHCVPGAGNSAGLGRPDGRLLPSSSSSEVMDLERRVRAVVGARLGGGGASGADWRDRGVRTWLGCRPPHPHASSMTWEPVALSLRGRRTGGRLPEVGEQQRSPTGAPLRLRWIGTTSPSLSEQKSMELVQLSPCCACG